MVGDLVMSCSGPGTKLAANDLEVHLLSPALIYLTKETSRAKHRNLSQA